MVQVWPLKVKDAPVLFNAAMASVPALVSVIASDQLAVPTVPWFGISPVGE
jgi:hypothetical protein